MRSEAVLYFQITKLLSHNSTTLSTTTSRLAEKELQAIRGGRARGCQVLFAWICQNLRQFSLVCSI